MPKIINVFCLLMLLPIAVNAEVIRVVNAKRANAKEYVYYENNKEIAREKLNEEGIPISMEGKIPDGVVKEYESKNIVKCEETWKNNVKEGITKGYFRGKLMFEENYKNGKRDGKAKWYYPSGKLMGETIWKEGEKEGISTLFYEEGCIKQETEYKGGKQISRKEYDFGGNLIQNIH